MTKAETPDAGSEKLPIPRLDSPSRQELLLRITNSRKPFILSGSVKHWAASSWTPEHFKKVAGESMVDALVDLPRYGMPYFWSDKNYGRTMRFAELIDKMSYDSASQCYLAQKNINAFPSLKSDFDFGEITPKLGARETSTSFWMGTGGTHSGLHFDRRDNVLVQLYGHKSVILAAPGQAQYLYPIHDMFEKSSVDPSKPDLHRHPKFRKAELYQAVIRPGDALFIPQLWWHYLESRDTSISLNHWYGDECSLKDLARMMLPGASQFGPRCSETPSGTAYVSDPIELACEVICHQDCSCTTSSAKASSAASG